METNTQLLSVGRQCSLSTCSLVDFLPFKCQHCSESFCGEHFLATAHSCPQYDESKHNRIAPSCPLCNTPVAIPPGEDPNMRMERHISADCSVMTGRSGRTRSQPVCARGKCAKVLYAPITCNSCQKQFCPQHRFPKDHSCAVSTAGSTPTRATPKLFPKLSIPQTTSSSSSVPSSSRTPPNIVPPLFSKTDRALSLSPKSTSPLATCRSPQIAHILDPLSRAKAERESKRKAMMERAKKGLLTEQETVMLAEEEAERAKDVAASRSDKECIVV